MKHGGRLALVIGPTSLPGADHWAGCKSTPFTQTSHDAHAELGRGGF